MTTMNQPDTLRERCDVIPLYLGGKKIDPVSEMRNVRSCCPVERFNSLRRYALSLRGLCAFG